MAERKYMSLERLQEYDALIKQEIANSVSGKADASHDHNSLYYTESEIDSKLSTINGSITNITNGSVVVKEAEHADSADEATHAGTADEATHASTADSATSAGSATKATQDASGNVITSTYETKSDATAKLNEAKSYTDTKTSGLASTTVVDNKISSHNTSTTAHSDIRNLISTLTTKVNNFLDVDDTTTDQLSEVLTLINNNKGTLDSLTSGKVNVSDIVDNLTTSSTTKVLSAKQGVALKALIDALQEDFDGHGHAIADVSGLQSALDGKAASSHGTHVTYSTTAPVMDGTASAGSAATVARSDHKHPTDTSRASKSEFDTHVADTTKHITSTERTNWGTAYTHSQAAHAPSDAEKNQNAFSNITIGTTTVAADSATDTVTFVGSNVTITPDATNDKITFAVASGSTSAKGIVQLTNSTSSTSTTTAATPAAVKSAYDLANTANTAAAAAQATADGKANASHTHTVANITDLTVTATELNYMDGVTSGVQAQLDGKAASGHGHDVATTSANGFMSKDMVTKLNGIATGANKTTVDSSLSSSSTNPVQNKVVNSAISTLTSTVSSNTSSISAHTTAISNLQTAVGEIQDITSEDIISLFSNQ